MAQTTLRAGGDIVNDNFNELYTALGDGSALQISISGSPSSGDVLTWNGSAFASATPSTLANIVEDTTPTTDEAMDPQDLAKSLLAQAKTFEQEAKALKKQAYELAPNLKPGPKKTAKADS